VPVRLEYNIDEPVVCAIPHFALCIQLRDGRYLLLPLSLWLIGGTPTRGLWDNPLRKASEDAYRKNRPRFQDATNTQWDRSIPAFVPIFEKFADSPILKVADAQIVGGVMPSKRKTRTLQWVERRFETTYGLAPSLRQAEVYMRSEPQALHELTPDRNDYYLNVNLYNSLSVLIETVASVCPPVVFQGPPPSHPFAVLGLDAFVFQQLVPPPPQRFRFPSFRLEAATEDEAAEVEDDDNFRAAHPVDGQPSCVFHLQCTWHPQEGSRFCRPHHELVAECLRESKTAAGTGWQKASGIQKNVVDITWSSQANVIRAKPEGCTLSAVRLVHRLNSTYKIWAIDTEFAVARGTTSAPYARSIRDRQTTGDILRTAVDYSGRTLESLEDELAAHQEMHGSIPTHLMQRGYMSRWYPGATTHGMSMTAIGDSIRAAGFQPSTHKVISWSTSIDLAVFQRALLGHNDLIDTTPYESLMGSYEDVPCLQPFNLAVLVKEVHKLDISRLRLCLSLVVPRSILAISPPNELYAGSGTYVPAVLAQDCELGREVSPLIANAVSADMPFPGDRQVRDLHTM
jgi:hypothetical protein